MADLSLALDEIISTQRKGGRRPGGGGGGARRVGRPGIRGSGGRGNFLRDQYFSDDVPAGKWKHDKFMDLYGGGGRRRGGVGRSTGLGGGRSGNSRGGSSEIVHLNISNLPSSVVTADLEELFQDFGVYGVAVHYDESGAHLGTADLFVDAGSSKAIIREFTNIAIDGQEIKIALVDETAGKMSIRDRIERVARNPISRRKPVLRRAANGPRSRSGGRRSGGGGGGGGGGGRRGTSTNAGGGEGKKLAKMTAEELDKELEAYMSIRNSGKD